MDFGVDTVSTRLDLINWSHYSEWSSGALPIFAGRNFIGGNFLWGHAEATDARIHPHPDNLALLNIIGPPLIAPMQGIQTARQQLDGTRGYLAGALDAQALIQRIISCLVSTELGMASQGAYLWLAVDPTVPFSGDYWVGWSNYVNQFPAIGLPGTNMGQPFYACILCQYKRDAHNILQPDPNVIAALKIPAQGKNSAVYAFWADATDPNHPNLSPDQNVTWTGTFDDATAPIIWRVATGIASITDIPIDQSFSIDAIKPAEPPLPDATAYMLTVNKWQPNAPQTINLGVSASLVDNPDFVTDAQLTCIANTPFIAMGDAQGTVQFPPANVSTIGRYLEQIDRSGKSHSVGQAEVLRINNANIAMFSVWERGSPNSTAYFDPAQDQGTKDAQAAFFDSGVVLEQPPQTPVFFAIDYDAADPSPVSGGGPNGKSYVLQYFEKVAAARDAFQQQHPDRYYLIGAYATGAMLEALYEQGIVSYFWQSPSPGGSGNTWPNRPWCHVNRWQFRFVDGAHPVPGNWNCISGADPDADWGDGGSWYLTNTLSQQLIDAAQQASFFGWGNIYPP